jgi:GNAT superfamily N-acetyltransferase
LILIAEQASQPIGFMFALPDLLQAQRGQPIDTVILKTVAVHPDYRSFGLGSLLLDRCVEIARKLGYTRAIHALMHESNHSRKISSRYEAQIIRQYALFAREL